MPSYVIVIIVIIVALIAISLFFQFVPVGLWINARAAGVMDVNPATLIGMRLRRVPQDRVILPLIAASKAGIPVNVNQLETHYMAGGNVDRVVQALISAHRAEIPLTFEKAAAIDLAGRNVLEAVQMSVNPKVIETPNVAGVAQNGVEMKAFARVTVRANIDQFVGGAGEATVLARVGEGIVTSMGSAPTHLTCWRSRTTSPRRCWPRGWTRGRPSRSSPSTSPTWWWVRTSGPACRPTRPKPTRRLPRPRRRSGALMAVAREQEMKAYTQEMQAKVVEFQALCPKRWPMRCAAATLASWTTTICRICRPTRICAPESAA